jgi:hypothetical protein
MLKNNKGSTLVMLLLLLAVMSIVGIALMNTSVTENKHAILEHDYQQAYYIARAGAEATAFHLINDPLPIDTLKSMLSDPNGNYNYKKETPFGGGYFNVSLFNTDGKSNQKIIRSEGYYNGKTATVNIAIIRLPVLNSAVIARNSIEITNPSNVKLLGNISIAMPQEEDISSRLTLTNIKPEDFKEELTSILTDDDDGTVYDFNKVRYEFPHVGYVISDISDYNIKIDDEYLKKDMSGPLGYYEIEPNTLSMALSRTEIDESDNTKQLKNDDNTPVKDSEGNNITIDYSDKNYGDLTMNSSMELTITLNNNGIIDDEDGNILSDDSLKLYFNELNMGGATINVEGSGTLTVFVKEMEFKGDLKCVNGAKILFKVIDGGTVNVKTGNSTSELFFYGPYADFNISAAYTVIGSLVGDNIKFSAKGGMEFDANKGEFSPKIEFDTFSYDIINMAE